MPYILRKNISKFVFENSCFQIADAIQFLLCYNRSAAVLNKSRTCWATIVISSFYFFEINRKHAMGNSVMFILLHWYCHRGFGSGKMITFTSKIFNIFRDVYTHDGTISLCQRDASAQIVVSHNYRTQVLGSIPFTPSVVTKWHDLHRYLSIYHVPYPMNLSSPRHCSKTLKNKLQWNHDRNSCIFIQENAIENVICKMGPFCFSLNVINKPGWGY